jgi:hypothetical protein
MATAFVDSSERVRRTIGRVVTWLLVAAMGLLVTLIAIHLVPPSQVVNQRDCGQLAVSQLALSRCDPIR